jgi:hypothetical protein
MTSKKLRGIEDRIAIASPTVASCHLIGGLLSIAVILCTAWIWSLSRHTDTAIQVGDQVVTLQEAETLINNAEQWRSIHTSCLQKANEIQDRSQLIADWLPESIEWDATQAALESIIRNADVELLSLERGAESIGTRVGVIQATCEIEGSYIGICRVLNGIVNCDQPIACSEIKLHRLRDADVSGPTTCRAKLVFRIPFAAKGSAANQVLLSFNHYSE